MKDFIHNIINDNPDINIINLDELAHKLTKIFPWINPLIKSNPPKNIIKPIKTTMCMNNFFLLVNFFAKKDKIIIVRPNIVGIKEVIDWLSLKIVTTTPHTTKNIPYIIVYSPYFFPKI